MARSTRTIAPTSAKNAPLAPIGRALAILRKLVPASRWATFSELRTIEPNLSAASLSRLLKVLQVEQLVEKDEGTGRYRMGAGFLALARASIGTLPVCEILQPVIDALAVETRQSAALFECEGTGGILTAKTEMPESFHYIPIGQRMSSVLAHGFGQVMVAHAGPAARKALYAANGPVPQPKAAYEKRIADIAEGALHITDWTEKAAIQRVVAPVFRGMGGPIAGVLGVSFYEGGVIDSSLPAIEQAVAKAAQRASTLLSTGAAGN